MLGVGCQLPSSSLLNKGSHWHFLFARCFTIEEQSVSYIWAYASFQFAIVILFAHIFYNVLNVNSLLSVLLSSFTGFGIAISTNSLLVEYLRWRASRNPGFSLQRASVVAQQQQQQQQQQQLRHHLHHLPQHQRRQHEFQQQQQQQRQQQSMENPPVGPADGSGMQEMRTLAT
ncbi:transcriptional corepressor LEUNIG [Actinidia rufa]|uniref:Transcriptional corepressor LEUNIG n=1 Tax=Actinidia rufa TaxID=165716 RepID=A0A7J0G3W6_9ERIC|nr:transcriptional corepressor LEUNIG [Actinidia rufa]